MTLISFTVLNFLTCTVKLTENALRWLKYCLAPILTLQSLIDIIYKKVNEIFFVNDIDQILKVKLTSLKCENNLHV